MIKSLTPGQERVVLIFEQEIELNCDLPRCIHDQIAPLPRKTNKTLALH